MISEHSSLKVDDVIDERFRSLFPFQMFNRMQSLAVPVIMESDRHCVVAAPTASGKTVVAIAAMVHELSRPSHGKILYIAPMRALTNEKESEWNGAFKKIGFDVYVVSGERELSEKHAAEADVIITTPEKWDSATRKHQTDRFAFVRDISCVIIDEVHLIDSDVRGGTLEVLISRMKRINKGRLRIVALSATMPNIEDVAGWIGADEREILKFDDSYRPVKLDTDILAYDPKESDFINKYIRLYKALNLIRKPLREGHQALIFVSSRDDTVRSAKKLLELFEKDGRMYLTEAEYRYVSELGKLIKNQTLVQTIRLGIAFHHAGLGKMDRDTVENLFRRGVIKVLISTSTLAWGVNLPARVVVIRDVEINDPLEGNKELSPIDLLQMLGRAGRPQYDDRGYGWVIVPYTKAGVYRQILKEGKEIESVLHESLSEHINAEIAMGTINNINDAREWIKTTFLYRCVRKNPLKYNNLDPGEKVKDEVKTLISNGFIDFNPDTYDFRPTQLGIITSIYYVKIKTAILFREFAKKEDIALSEVLETVSKANEFSEIVIRPKEHALIKNIIKNRTINLKGGSLKVAAILLAYMHGEIPAEFRSDGWVIKQNAERLLKALEHVFQHYSTPTNTAIVKNMGTLIRNSIPDEAESLLQIQSIDIRTIKTLIQHGITDIQELAARTPQTLKATGIDETKAKRILKELERYQTDHLQQRLVPDEDIMRECLVDALPWSTVDKIADIMVKEQEHTPISSVERQDIHDIIEELIEQLENHPDNHPVYLIAGHAEIEYSGRKDDRNEGQRLIIIKPGGTIIVHAATGLKPLNYQAKEAKFKIQNHDSSLVITSESARTKEKLRIKFSQTPRIIKPFV
ncbi:superfamily II helicase [Candidatus Methanoperedens nitroreducens]|uniref:Superfamily II helicase n=1 Tax=Candidatus Methanoperedens nitratireducens TaxID=1392998 RepID=A0A062V6V4_9EURY|nr:DEAD/DEAH box helicase [Candidatus Methanoperedens nitroreducens]KCZ71489.1 superfamily II helicase [Candidatus Methanoperedens nitroreducens]MDJ1421118.1 endonuclease NucS [Candidatus Methanoperedens sp.]